MINTKMVVEIIENDYTLSKTKDKEVTAIGIDGGTTNLGVAIIFINVSANKISRIKTFNLRVKGKVDLTTRIHMMGNTLDNLFIKYKPFTVGVETPFISLRNIRAVIPLSRMYQRTLDSILTASKSLISLIRHYDIVPIEAKQRAGGTGRSDKDEMRAMLIKDKSLNELLESKIEDMTEHEIDAVYIGLTAHDKYIALNGEEEIIIRKSKKRRKK